MQVWKDYQEKNKERFLNELLDLLRIPSVSAKTEHKPDMISCAEAVKQRLLEAGADKRRTDKLGNTAHSVAQTQGAEGVLHLLSD